MYACSSKLVPACDRKERALMRDVQILRLSIICDRYFSRGDFPLAEKSETVIFNAFREPVTLEAGRFFSCISYYWAS